jgi:large subunit ribosomal protein L6
MITKSFCSTLFEHIFVCKLNNNVLIVLSQTEMQEKQFVLVPSYVHLSKKDDVIFLSCGYSHAKKFNTFLTLFSKKLACFSIKSRKKVILTGLGYRITFSSDLKALIFKIGFSHLVNVPIPSMDLSVIITKKAILIEGTNPVAVGNFAKKIKFLRKKDSYKGKGFRYKSDSRVLKPVKKK